MNILSFLSAVKAPKSLWVTLINWIKSGVGNLGWTIILVTALIKLVTTPLEFWVKYNTKRQTLIQQKCAPQVAKLQKKFGNDRQTLQVQTQSLYKREGLDMRTGCIVMLVNMILSFTIFMTFYSDLRKISAYEAINQYEQIEATYTKNFNQAFVDYSQTDDFASIEDVTEWFTTYNAMPESTDEEKQAKQVEYNKVLPQLEYATNVGSEKAVECWKNNKKPSSWLWVQNIWVADSTAKAFPTYSSLKSMAGSTYKDDVEAINEENYNKISNLILSDLEENSRTNNGYFILPILAGLITFLSQYISELHTRLKNKKANKVAKNANDQNAQTMKIMKIVMPLIMVIFTLSSSASFGLYILSSNLTTILLGELTTLIIDALTKKKRLEVEAELEKEANRLIKKGKLDIKEDAKPIKQNLLNNGKLKG